MKLFPIITVALLGAVIPARADDTTKAPPAAKPSRTPLAEELNKLRLDLALALNKDHPIHAATRDAERAAVEKLLSIYERGLKLAADHPDAPEAKAARTWAAGGFAAFPVTDRARQQFADALDGLPAADRAGLRLQLARSLERVAGQPWYTRAEAARLTADADATLAAVLHDLDGADDARSKQLRQRAEDVRHVVRHLSVGQPAPDAASEGLDGKPVKLGDLRGKVVVLDFWFTGCFPCKQMIPHQRELVARLKDKPFALVSISADAEKSMLTEFLDTTPMPWTHWYSGSKAGLVADWKVSAFPTVYVLDATGVIRFKGVRGKALDLAVDTLLAE